MSPDWPLSTGRILKCTFCRFGLPKAADSVDDEHYQLLYRLMTSLLTKLVSDPETIKNAVFLGRHHLNRYEHGLKDTKGPHGAVRTPSYPFASDVSISCTQSAFRLSLFVRRDDSGACSYLSPHLLSTVSCSIHSPKYADVLHNLIWATAGNENLFSNKVPVLHNWLLYRIP